MSGTCRTCAFWGKEEEWNPLVSPIDPDTWEPMETEFEVRQCQHPRLMENERPLEANGFGVADGSGYMAVLNTAQDFGCVKYEEGTA